MVRQNKEALFNHNLKDLDLLAYYSEDGGVVKNLNTTWKARVYEL
jgi:hypothetical protein